MIAGLMADRGFFDQSFGSTMSGLSPPLPPPPPPLPCSSAPASSRSSAACATAHPKPAVSS